jgi:hypothetical protein
MTSNPPPQVSVLLPVYNCPGYVGAAIESILNQSFSDFELIIIDDGSTDSTPEELDRFSDPRIRRYRQDNQGLAATLNRAIFLAKAPLLARQDQDDLSMPERLKKQVLYMHANPECGLLGSWAQIMEINKLSSRFHRHPTSDWELRYGLLFNNPFVHSSVMLRKSVVTELGGYTTDPERQPPEDYELWSRIARVSAVANIPDVLLIYREIPGSMSRTGVSPFQRRLVRISAENIAHSAGVEPNDSSVTAIACLTHGTPEDLSGTPDFRLIRTILFRALEQCASPANRPTLQIDAELRLTSLKASWLAYNVPILASVQRLRPFRKIAKGCLALFRRLPSMMR